MTEREPPRRLRTKAMLVVFYVLALLGILAITSGVMGNHAASVAAGCWSVSGIAMVTYLFLRNHELYPKPGRCPSCGYNLSGLEEGTVCPECGK